MKFIKRIYQNSIFVLLNLFTCIAGINTSLAQCSTGSAPTYSNICVYEYFSSITASGTGVVSTMSVTATSCSGTYTDLYSTQGIAASVGDTVNINVSRFTTSYNAYLSVYVDWNNDGTYDTTEHAGSMIALTPSTLSTVYSFVVPACLTTATNLHMRIMLSESVGGAGTPCTANYGETRDFYINVACATPSAITVSPTSDTFCSGNSVTLTASGAVSGVPYSWSPSSGLSVTTGTSVVATPSVTTVYTVTAGSICSGCATGIATTTITVVPTPIITAPIAFCEGVYTTLSSTVAGGTWSLSNPSVATINASTGVIYGIHGSYDWWVNSTTITYHSPNGCDVTGNFGVGHAPPPIIGTTTVCQGGTIVLSDTASFMYSNGLWSSGDSSIATPDLYILGPSVNIIGVSAGTTIISFTFQYCTATASVTVFQGAGSISGPTSVCPGSSITLSDATTGGAWSSGNIAVASITSSGGVLTGGSLGTALVTFTAPDGCIATTTITTTGPSAISGIRAVCTGSTSTLSNLIGGGTWSSSNTGVATISSSGVVHSVSTGTTTITYAIGSCSAVTTATVYATPVAITGTTTVCTGANTTLGNTVTGGVWSSNNVSIATVNSSSGVVHGVSAGTAIITYATGGGACFVTTTVTVNITPAAITGPLYSCTGFTSAFSDATSGGVWASTNTAQATISSTGVATAISAGGTTIYYTISGCTASTALSIYNATGPISGVSSVCGGSNITLSNTVGGGWWITGNAAVATVNASSGVVTGVSGGTVAISYTTGGICISTTTITVIAPTAITGIKTLCTGGTTVLSNSVAGGAWSSSVNTVATVSSTGVIYGVGGGTTTISYTVGGCSAITTATVYATPTAISGASSVCSGSSITLSNSVGGGAWSSSNSTQATVNATTGIVTGVSAGAVIISYSTGGMCITTTTVTVFTSPSAISGTAIACTGATTSLSDAVSGGTWSSSNTGIATISSIGVVSGVAAGTATITYNNGGCIAVSTASVYPTPTAISGPSSVCGSSTISLSDGVAGGTWSSSNTSWATVNPTSGVVTGLYGAIPGVGVSIFYTTGGTCTTYLVVTVNGIPPAITGTTNACIAATRTLSDPQGGGIWSSSNTSVATVSGAGVVRGVATGATTISYTISGCSNSVTFNVYNTPGAISGLTSLCGGTNIPLSNTVSGGTWSSSNTVATVVSSTGTVTGVSAGTARITYSLGGSCIATTTITVSAPAVITGSRNVSVGYTTILSDATGSGVWSSSNSSVATIASTGVVSGVALGTTTISYTVGGCAAVATVTVTPAPSTISGSSTVCSGTITLSNSVAGGTWSSSNTSIATVTPITGIVTGVSIGTVIITYTSAGGGYSTITITNNLPSVITGTLTECVGGTTTLSDATPAGAWSSSNSAIATISSTGVVSGVVAGTTNITYTVSGCFNTTVITIFATPAAIAGPSSTCTGTWAQFTNSVAGGTWSSSNPAKATIDASSGWSVGVAVGTTTISYSTGVGCTATQTFSVALTPAPITGPYFTLCVGSTITLADGTSGGTWFTHSGTIAAISSTGVVTGNSPGSTYIDYTVGGCISETSVQVYAVPAAIIGPSAVCMGSNITLSTDQTSGTWNSSSTPNATVSPTNGLVHAISAGSATITYTSPGRCFVTKALTIDAPPTATGSASLNVGNTVTFTGSPGGGTWSSSNTAIATVSSTGVVHVIASGTVTITYSLGSCAFNIVVVCT